MLTPASDGSGCRAIGITAGPLLVDRDQPTGEFVDRAVGELPRPSRRPL
ncbi:hypothetical protein [Actinoplanes ianthinogenes]|nr:hypothetical protein [Actinoplanes ianthinogenes]